MIKELFIVDETSFLVELNKTWISTIKEFRDVIKADKGSKGDTQARKKLLAKKQFTFIYHFADYKSQFVDYPEEERREEALRNAGLMEADITGVVERAIDKYRKLQHTSTLGMLESAEKAIHKMKEYFDNINFTDEDDMGKLKYSPKELMSNIKSLGDTYEGLKTLEELVKKDMSKKARVRGDAKLGNMETPQSLEGLMQIGKQLEEDEAEDNEY